MDTQRIGWHWAVAIGPYGSDALCGYVMLEEVGPDRSGRVQRDERETLDDQRGTLPCVDQRPDEPPVIGACGGVDNVDAVPA
jgi:hypothetical protein